MPLVHQIPCLVSGGERKNCCEKNKKKYEKMTSTLLKW